MEEIALHNPTIYNNFPVSSLTNISDTISKLGMILNGGDQGQINRKLTYQLLNNREKQSYWNDSESIDLNSYAETVI